jgi:CDP-diglyceride synthetase
MTNTNFLFVTAMFVFPFLCILIPILAGQQYGMHIKTKSGKINDSPVGSVVGAALGLLAFMLAFTFQIVDNRYNDRKGLLLDEVTAIRTTYLQSGLIPEPYRNASRKLLIEYVAIRSDLTKDISVAKIEHLKVRSQFILDSLWKFSEELAAQDRSSEAYSLYISSVNDLVEIYNKRVTFTFEYRIPTAILWVLLLVTFASMFILGYQFGISGKKNNILAFFISIIFASVMFLILILDRPETGLMRLNQTPILTLQKQLHEK